MEQTEYLVNPFSPSAVLGRSAKRTGLVAGWGHYPRVVARALRRQGRCVVCAGIKDHVDPDLPEECHEFTTVGLAQLGRMIRYFRRQHVCEVTLAGKVHKTTFFQPGFLWKNLPDWTCLRTFAPHFLAGTRDRSDDSLLQAVVAAFRRGGIEVIPATDLVPEVIMGYGTLAGAGLSRMQRLDVEFGWRIAKELGRLDVGQSVAVKGQAVLAVEAIEGTDQCIRRAGQLCPTGEFTVVKVAKPQQDMRFDVPVVGIGTVQTMWQAGARVLAVEADRTILIDAPEVRAFAMRHGLQILALRDGVVTQDLLAA